LRSLKRFGQSAWAKRFRTARARPCTSNFIGSGSLHDQGNSIMHRQQ
jgi:hypothetical protein